MKKKLTLNMETVRNLEDSDVNTVVGGGSIASVRLGVLSASIRQESEDTFSMTNSFSNPMTDGCPPPFTDGCPPDPPQSMFCPGLSFANLSGETVIIGGQIGGGFRQR